MATENNSQINTFVKGMNTDVSYQMIQEGQYTFGRNIRVTALNATGADNVQNGQGEVRAIEGVVRVGDDFGYEDILAVDTIRNIGCIIYTQDGTWKVGRFENKIGDAEDHDRKDDYIVNGVTITQVFDSNQVPQHDKFSMVLRYENDENIMAYIADGENPLCVLNIMKDNGNNLDAVRIYPEVNYTPFQFKGLVDGSLSPALVQYSYQLYNKYQNYTNISPCTNLIPIVHQSGTYGYLSDQQSGSGVRLQLNLTRPKFDYILIYRITYKEAGQTPLIELIYDGNLSNINGKEFLDTGLNSLSVLSLEEYNGLSGVHIIPKVIESKNDYLFAGNIKDVTSWITKEEMDSAFKDKVQCSVVLGDSRTADYDVNARYIKYVSNDLLDDKKPENRYNHRSLRNGETYRYGIILYNKYGESSNVYHIGDVQVNKPYNQLFDVTQDNKLKVNNIHLRVSFSDDFTFPEGTVAYEIVRCNRKEDDVINLMQGVLSRPGCPYTYDNMNEDNKPEYMDLYTPIGYLTTNRLDASTQTADFGDSHITNFIYSNRENLRIFNFVSPEISYLPETTIDLIKNKNIKLQPVLKLYPISGWDSLFSSFSLTQERHGYFDLQENRIRMLQNEPGRGSDNNDYFFVGYNSDWQNPTDVTATNVNIKRNCYTYIKLYNKEQANNISPYEISEFKLSNIIPYNQVLTGNVGQNGGIQFSMHNYIQAIGTISYDNICTYGCDVKEQDSVDTQYPFSYSYSPFGSNLLIYLDTQQNDSILTNIPFGTFLCNIKQDVIPYGGSSTVPYSVYSSYGQYFKVSQKQADVFDGDSTIFPFEYVSMHKYYTAGFKVDNTEYDEVGGRCHCMVYSIPVETSIQLPYTSGFEFSKNHERDAISNIQPQPVQILGKLYNYQQTKPLYVYNSAYSSNATSRQFASYEDYDEQDNENLLNKYDTRIYYAGPKSNNEKINSWNRFQPNSYIDVDNKYGELTHIRHFNNKLVFWQEQAFGLLSVNERVQITDNSNLPLILGTGGVLDRYDYVDSTSGMHKEQFCDTASPSTLYWFDDDNQEMKAYSDGGGVVQLTKSAGVQNLMHKFSNTENKPWLFFDKRYNEVVAKVLSDNCSLVYNEQLKAFTSIYDIEFDGSATFSNGLYLIRNGIYQWNKSYDKQVRGTDSSTVSSELEYVVNKAPLTTKVFDNQEIVTHNMPELNSKVNGRKAEDTEAYFRQNHNYYWKTDLNQTGDITDLPMTLREGNYRYAVPRAGKEAYGNRMRGKYMVCGIVDKKPTCDASITYIITKFRTSWS